MERRDINNTDIVAKQKVLLLNTGCPKKTWEFSDEFDIVFLNNSLI